MLGARSAARYRRLHTQALAGTHDRVLDSLLSKASGLYSRVERLSDAAKRVEKGEKAAPRRLLMQLASTQERVRLLERLNRLLDVIRHDCSVPEPEEDHHWRKFLRRERRAQAERVCRVLGREDAPAGDDAAEAPAGDAEEEESWAALTRTVVAQWVSECEADEQMEMLTLLFFAASGRGADYGLEWMESEQRALNGAYELVALAAGVVVVTLPEWFASPMAREVAPPMVNAIGGSDSTEDEEEQVTVLPLASLPPLVGTAGSFQEESVIRQARAWATLRYPRLVRLGGACHVGGARCFVVNAPLEPLLQAGEEETTESVLLKLREASEGLQFLHERGLFFSTGSDDASVLEPLKVYSSLGSSTVQLLGVGLMDLAWREDRATLQGEESASEQDQRVGQTLMRAQADDVYTLGLWIAEWSSSSALRQSVELWDMIELMWRPDRSERPSAYYVAQRLDIMGGRQHESWRFGEMAELSVMKNPELSQQDADTAVDEILVEIVQRSSDTRVSTRIREAYRLLRDPDRQFPVHFLQEFCFRCTEIVLLLYQDRFKVMRAGRVQEDADTDDQDGANSFPDWARNGLNKLDQLVARLGLADYFGSRQLPAHAASEWPMGWLIPSSAATFFPLYDLDEIGRGGFGSVHSAQWGGAPVAIKRLHPELDSLVGSLASFYSSDSLPEALRVGSGESEARVAARQELRTAALREARVWHLLDHLNVIKMYGACLDNSPPFFISELATGGSSDRAFYGRDEPIAPYVIWSRLLDAARGVQYLHHKGIVHGDLKGNNIMVDVDGVAKLIDFGLSFFASEGQPEELRGQGPARWMAPECMSMRSDPEVAAKETTFASDVYSFGMCIIEAVSGEIPWGWDMPDVGVKYHILRRQQLPVRPPEIKDNEWALVERMCRFNPGDRLAIDYVVIYLAQLVERLGSPTMLAHTPSSLLKSSFGVSKLLNLVRSNTRADINSLLQPDAFFATARVLRLPSTKWTSSQVRDLLSLLDRDDNDKSLWVARVLGQLAPDALGLARSAIECDTDVVVSLLALAKSGSREGEIAGTTALRRLSTGCTPIKRAIGACGGVSALLLIAGERTRPLEAKAMAVATLRNVSTLGADELKKWELRTGSIEDWTLATLCATLDAVLSPIRTDESQLCQSVRVDVVGVLRNVAFQSRYGASSVLEKGEALPVFVSFLACGTIAEKTEAAGALWNVITSSDRLSAAALFSIVVALAPALQCDEASSEALHQQVVGALHAVLTKVTSSAASAPDTIWGYFGTDDDFITIKELAARLRRVAISSKSAATRELAADAALQLVGR